MLFLGAEKLFVVEILLVGWLYWLAIVKMCFLILKKFRLSNELTIIPSRDAILHQNCIILPEVYQDLLTCTPKLYRHSKNKVVTSSKTFHKLYIIRIFAFCSLKTCLQLFQILVCVFHCKNNYSSKLLKIDSEKNRFYIKNLFCLFKTIERDYLSSLKHIFIYDSYKGLILKLLKERKTLYYKINLSHSIRLTEQLLKQIKF